MAVWTVRVLDGADPAAVSTTRFADVEPDSFYAPFIERMAELGVTAGYGDGTGFCPDGTVTRAQMAVFLTRAFSLAPGPDPGFTDVPADAWYFDQLTALAASGITKGCDDGTVFCPGRDTTRAQMATFLYRALHRDGSEEPVRVPTSGEAVVVASGASFVAEFDSVTVEGPAGALSGAARLSVSETRVGAGRTAKGRGVGGGSDRGERHRRADSRAAHLAVQGRHRILDADGGSAGVVELGGGLVDSPRHTRRRDRGWRGDRQSHPGRRPARRPIRTVVGRCPIHPQHGAVRLCGHRRPGQSSSPLARCEHLTELNQATVKCSAELPPPAPTRIPVSAERVFQLALTPCQPARISHADSQPTGTFSAGGDVRSSFRAHSFVPRAGSNSHHRRQLPTQIPPSPQTTTRNNYNQTTPGWGISLIGVTVFHAG